MHPGSEHEGLQLAKQRWAQLNDFDIPDETWMQLFHQFGCGLTLEAIKVCRKLNDPRPERRYEIFLGNLERMYAAKYR